MCHVCGFICYLCVELKLMINTRSLSNQALKPAHPSLLCCPLLALRVFIGAGQPLQHGEVRDTNLAWVRPVPVGTSSAIFARDLKLTFWSGDLSKWPPGCVTTGICLTFNLRLVPLEVLSNKAAGFIPAVDSLWFTAIGEPHQEFVKHILLRHYSYGDVRKINIWNA